MFRAIEVTCFNEVFNRSFIVTSNEEGKGLNPLIPNSHIKFVTTIYEKLNIKRIKKFLSNLYHLINQFYVIPVLFFS